MVEEALQPGVSVARVARAHGVNANQLFGWRRLYPLTRTKKYGVCAGHSRWRADHRTIAGAPRRKTKPFTSSRQKNWSVRVMNHGREQRQRSDEKRMLIGAATVFQTPETV
jgi:Transposase